ncbi:tol-pal system protein YbgF [Serratia microhaemolytica]|uniref:tol-pal system protein YbgF n=1 Tax=Serratia microhaemolytica TaxID=2675110 RepID=UPI000FDD5719
MKMRLILPLLATLLLTATPSLLQAASNSTNSVADRLTSLERISYARGQLLNQIQRQLSDNQRDIDMLRGQLQETQHKLQQLTEQQKQLYQQVESLTQVEQKPESVTAATPAQAAAEPANEHSDYSIAVTLALEKKQYDEAISAFQSFIKRYPQSSYQPNANYWLGQLFYNNKGQRDEASYYYAVVVKNYPNSAKAPDAMYKVGVIMQEKGQLEKAKAVYQQVSKLYPNSEAAKLAKKRVSSL